MLELEETKRKMYFGERINTSIAEKCGCIM